MGDEIRRRYDATPALETQLTEALAAGDFRRDLETHRARLGHAESALEEARLESSRLRARVVELQSRAEGAEDTVRELDAARAELARWNELEAGLSSRIEAALGRLERGP